MRWLLVFECTNCKFFRDVKEIVLFLFSFCIFWFNTFRRACLFITIPLFPVVVWTEARNWTHRTMFSAWWTSRTQYSFVGRQIG
jgi:hypothetical protein